MESEYKMESEMLDVMEKIEVVLDKINHSILVAAVTHACIVTNKQEKLTREDLLQAIRVAFSLFDGE
jgi:hypothetical protein